MSRNDDIRRMRQLEQELDYHSQRYYVDNAPEISDFEFDALLRELQDLEATYPEEADPNSPTKRVGSDLTTEFESVEHRYPMQSFTKRTPQHGVLKNQSIFKNPISFSAIR